MDLGGVNVGRDEACAELQNRPHSFDTFIERNARAEILCDPVSAITALQAVPVLSAVEPEH